MASQNSINTNLVSALTIFVALFAALAITASTFLEVRDEDAVSVNSNVKTAATECLADKSCKAPRKLISLAETLAAGSDADIKMAKQLAERALVSDDLQPGTWALLAFIHTKEDGRLSPSAIAALRNSLRQCKLCNNQALLRWRLQFVLQTWDEVPEDIRLTVFEGADLLRWWHLDEDFLAAQSDFAEQSGIPFHVYKSQVKSPVRPVEIR